MLCIKPQIQTRVILGQFRLIWDYKRGSGPRWPPSLPQPQPPPPPPHTNTYIGYATVCNEWIKLSLSSFGLRIKEKHSPFTYTFSGSWYIIWKKSITCILVTSHLLQLFSVNLLDIDRLHRVQKCLARVVGVASGLGRCRCLRRSWPWLPMPCYFSNLHIS